MTETVGDGQRFGRSWADVLERSFWLIVGLGIAAAIWIFGGDAWGRFPVWVWVSLAMSMIFLPYLIARAREGSRLVLVADGALGLTEWRMGRRYPLRISGEPLWFSSESGSQRMLLTHFEPETGDAEGTALAGATVFDLARDLSAFDRLGQSYAAHLREERITLETVGVEVERRVSEYSDAWLRLLYGSLDLSELEELLGVDAGDLEIPDDSVGAETLPEGGFDE